MYILCIYIYIHIYIHYITLHCTTLHYIYTTLHYIHTYIPAYLHTYIPTYLNTYIPTYLRTYVPTYLHTYIPTYLHTYIPTYIHTYIPTYLHSYITLHYISYVSRAPKSCKFGGAVVKPRVYARHSENIKFDLVFGVKLVCFQEGPLSSHQLFWRNFFFFYRLSKYLRLLISSILKNMKSQPENFRVGELGQQPVTNPCMIYLWQPVFCDGFDVWSPWNWLSIVSVSGCVWERGCQRPAGHRVVQQWLKIHHI